MIGFFKKIISRGEKEDILKTIEDYRKGLLPLVVPVTALLSLFIVTPSNEKKLFDL